MYIAYYASRSSVIVITCENLLFLQIWSLDSGTCLSTLTGHQDAVTCLQFDANKIISGSLDSNLKFWDLHTGQCTSTIDWAHSEGHTGVVR